MELMTFKMDVHCFSLMLDESLVCPKSVDQFASRWSVVCRPWTTTSLSWRWDLSGVDFFRLGIDQKEPSSHGKKGKKRKRKQEARVERERERERERETEREGK